VRPDREQTGYDEHAERGRRLDVLQRAEHEFDPIPFDSEAARAYGQVIAAVIGTGRTPRRRTAGLMIASTAIAAGLPLYTANPDDFAGLDDLLAVVPVTCPQVHRERMRPRLFWRGVYQRRAVGAPYRRQHGKAGISRRDKNMTKNQLPRWPATS
jgi:hypothetical protein